MKTFLYLCNVNGNGKTLEYILRHIIKKNVNNINTKCIDC